MINSIKLGLKALVTYDSYLLLNDVNERSITHRLGMYYQSIFPSWDVDCEFNKNLGDSKRIDIDPHLFLGRMADLLEGDGVFSRNHNAFAMLREDHISYEDIHSLKSQLRDPNRLKYDKELDIMYFVLTSRDNGKLRKLIYPDIIVHQRGTKNNYIVIEAKKSTYTDSISRAYDLVKLITLVRSEEYKYKRGYFIDIPTGEKAGRHKKFVFKSERLEKRVFTVESVS